jgi:predicted transcriptional regulator
MLISTPKAEKITVTIPSELKEKLYELKNEFQTTMSSIYKEALKEYIDKKEKEKWVKATALMAQEYENNPELKEWIDFEEDMYDYKTS